MKTQVERDLLQRTSSLKGTCSKDTSSSKGTCSEDTSRGENIDV